MRKSMIVANWKMNGTKLAVEQWLHAIIRQLSESSTVAREWIFCPPSVYLASAADLIKASGLKNDHLLLGAQNCHTAASGAFTGEVSPNMLVDLGCRYVLVGHSERRQFFQENNQMVAEKVRAAQQAGLVPILCVGETAEERKTNRTQTVIETQLETAFQYSENKTKIVIAYEPLWAIGTGLTATPEQAQAVHQQIRGWLVSNGSEATAASLRLLYGGSVNPKNAAGLLMQSDIDGLLVGGASLKASDFIEIGNCSC